MAFICIEEWLCLAGSVGWLATMGKMLYYFMKWSADGTWERVSGCLSLKAREQKTRSQLPLFTTVKA
jgi:hypothetical protein